MGELESYGSWLVREAQGRRKNDDGPRVSLALRN